MVGGKSILYFPSIFNKRCVFRLFSVREIKNRPKSRCSRILKITKWTPQPLSPIRKTQNATPQQWNRILKITKGIPQRWRRISKLQNAIPQWLGRIRKIRKGAPQGWRCIRKTQKEIVRKSTYGMDLVWLQYPIK